MGVLTEWRGISSRLEGSPVDCSIVSLSPFEGERERERITSANAFPCSLAKSQLETALNGGSIGDRR